MTKRLSLFESHSWLGQFSYANGAVNPFAGILRYSPERGLQLEYLLEFDRQTPATDVLLGVLQDGTTCTLYGDFSPAEGGHYWGSTASIYNGIRGLRFGVFGAHHEANDSFSGLDLDFNNFQEFCFPEQIRDQVAYSDEPLIDADCGEFRAQIVNRGSFRFASARLLANELHSENESLLADLRKAIEEVVNRYPGSYVHRRSKIEWSLRLLSDADLPAKAWMNRLYDFELLFSLLLFKPARPVEIQLKARDVEGKLVSFPVIGGLGGVTGKALAHLKRDQLQHQLPVCRDSIDLGTVIKRWLSLKDSFVLFASKIMDDFGDRPDLGTRSELVILLAQLESIARKAGFNHKKRYECALKAFGQPALCEQLLKLFGVSSLALVAASLSDLRAEVAHLDRQPIWLSTLTLRQRIALNRCIELVIMSFIYKELGIAEIVIQNFQIQQLQLIQDWIHPISAISTPPASTIP